jgi:hypothetical protein
MIGASFPRRSVAGSALRALIPFEAVALLFAGVVHLVGARIPLGAVVFDEPPIIPAGIVEGMAGVIFVVATYAVLAGRPWAWPGALAAHLFAIAGFLLGIAATRNGTTPFNRDYHFVMLAVFVVGLILLLTPGGRAVQGGGTRGAESVVR